MSLSQKEIDEKFMNRAFEIARASVSHGNQPFGAIVKDREGNIVCEVENTELTKGPTHHAEMNAVRKIEKMIMKEGLSREAPTLMTIYTSTQCCQMCEGACKRIGFERIVYGCPAGKMSEVAHRGELKKEKKGTLIEGPLLEDAAVSVYLDYWPNRQKQ